MTIYFKDNKILFDGGSVAMSADCCCDCDTTTCNDASEKIITQVDYDMDLPNVFDVWQTILDPDTFEPEFYDRWRYTGLDSFDGTYSVTRAAYPDCSWTFPSQSYSISWERRRWSAFACPSGSGTFQASGSHTWQIDFQSGAPLNHEVRFFTGSLSGAELSYSPTTLNPCGTSNLEATDGGLAGCISQTTYGSSTAQSFE